VLHENPILKNHWEKRRFTIFKRLQ